MGLRYRPGRNARRLALHLVQDVFYDRSVLVLGAKEDDLGVSIRTYRVARGPVEKIAAVDLVLGIVGETDSELAFDQVAPWGDWQRSFSSPWSRGVMSVPAASEKYSPPILPYPVASPKSVIWRATAPGASILTGTSFFAIRILYSFHAEKCESNKI